MNLAIIGCGRSGTSMVAKTLASCGLKLGPASYMPPADAHNPAGYYENRHVVWLNAQVLTAAFGPCSYLNPPSTRPAGEWWQDKRLRPHRQSAQAMSKIIQAWKDPRATFTLPLWRAVTPYKAVAVVRHPYEVADSWIGAYAYEKLPGLTQTEALRRWQLYNEALLRLDDVYVTFYSDWLEDFDAELERVLAYIKSGWPDVTAARPEWGCNVSAPRLRHHHYEERDICEFHLREIWTGLRERARSRAGARAAA